MLARYSAALCLLAFHSEAAQVQDLGPADQIFAYLETLARDDGGYAWNGQNVSYLTPTYYVIGSYHALGQTPPSTDRLAEWVVENHPRNVRSFSQEHRHFDYQHLQALSWLGQDISQYSEYGSKSAPYEYPQRYEAHGYPSLKDEASVLLSREMLGMEEPVRTFIDYLESRKRSNGSYNNTPTSDGSDGNLLNTWASLEAIGTLAGSVGSNQNLIDWINACQLLNGGFTHQPEPSLGGIDDVAYTWAAVRSLASLNEAPIDRTSCLIYLSSLANSDGGFGDRPGWQSNPRATFYVLDALQALGALDETLANLARPSPARVEPIPVATKVFSIQLEAHGQGSPADAVLLADSLNIHLWGAKNADPEWIETAQSLAHASDVPVTFFVSNEEYGSWVKVPGMGTYSHMSDIVAPAGSQYGPALAKDDVVDWDALQRRRVVPLNGAGGRLIWQFAENEPLIRLVLDDSLDYPGYAAISTFHFGNIDFTTSEPILHRWRGQIPYVVLQDAHGPEPWWFADMTTGMRTVFLASEPTWEAWLGALGSNRVVAIRHDDRTGNETWMHGGSDEVVDFVRSHGNEWQWWDNEEIQRPMVSVVLIDSEDKLEVGRPENGAILRIRCAWKNSSHGQLVEPICELLSIAVDGTSMIADLVSKSSSRPELLDESYHVVDVSNLEAGVHTAEVSLRMVGTGEEFERTVRFEKEPALSAY